MTAEQSLLLGHLDAGASRLAEDLFRHAANRIRTRLVNRVGTDLPVNFAGTEWTTVGPVMERLAAGCAFATLRLQPSGLVGWVAVEHGLLSRLVGRILGQPTTTNEPPVRAPSRFDLVITRRIAEDALGGICEILPPGAADRVDVLEAAASVRGPTLPPTALVGTTTYEVGTPNEPLGRLTVVLPSEVIRVATPKRTTRASEEAGIDRVLPLPVTLTAELGRLRMSLSALRALKPGDQLDLGPVRDVVLRTGDRATFTGEAGITNGFRSIKVHARVSPGTM
jgi:flagellar motor switch protein FliM